MARFLIDHRDRCELTNEELATALGYARPNIVSMWKACRTKVPLDVVVELASRFHVDLSLLLALFIDQYVSDHDGVDRFEQIARTMQRLPTEDEWEIVALARRCRNGNSLPLTPDQRRVLEAVLTPSAPLPAGPYEDINSFTSVVSGGDRGVYARRGHGRGMTKAEIATRGSRPAETETTQDGSNVVEFTTRLALDEASLVDALSPPTSSLNVRLPAALHRELKIAAVRANVSLAAYTEQVLTKHASVLDAEARP